MECGPSEAEPAGSAPTAHRLSSVLLQCQLRRQTREHGDGQADHLAIAAHAEHQSDHRKSRAELRLRFRHSLPDQVRTEHAEQPIGRAVHGLLRLIAGRSGTIHKQVAVRRREAAHQSVQNQKAVQLHSDPAA